jgi:polyisoprenyl-phosphate glycosyltransferase
MSKTRSQGVTTAQGAPERPWRGDVRAAGSTVDVVIPARNEEATIGAIVSACRRCAWVREVIVVDDGSIDHTAARASAAGATVVTRAGSGGSKGAAMARGIATSDAAAILFVDADLLHLQTSHLDQLHAARARTGAAMVVGLRDYGRLNPFIARTPPLTGERLVARWVLDAVAEEHWQGYGIELHLDALVARTGGGTAASTMRGVTQRTKRQKFGTVVGGWRTLQMAVGLMRLAGPRALGTYRRYLEGLVVVTACESGHGPRLPRARRSTAWRAAFRAP